MNTKFKRKVLATLLFIMPLGLVEAQNIEIAVGSNRSSFNYTAEILTRALAAEGYNAIIRYVGIIPTPRLEYMMAAGDVSCFILSKTAARSSRFLTVDVGMTNGLVSHRILFIRKEDQPLFDKVYTLSDLQKLSKVVGMGESWGDVAIWKENALPVKTIGGDWKRLYMMVASGRRNVDYLSRGAQEMVSEYLEHPELAVEKNLVLVYPKDHVLYVSPKKPELHKLLTDVMTKAQASGLIAQVARELYPDVYLPPVNLDQRRVIHLALPEQ